MWAISYLNIDSITAKVASTALKPTAHTSSIDGISARAESSVLRPATPWSSGPPNGLQQAPTAATSKAAEKYAKMRASSIIVSVHRRTYTTGADGGATMGPRSIACVSAENAFKL